MAPQSSVYATATGVLIEGAIRAALLQRIDKRWGSDSDTLVVEELGTHLGTGRVDVAVGDEALRAYETKSGPGRDFNGERLGVEPQADSSSSKRDFFAVRIDHYG